MSTTSRVKVLSVLAASSAAALALSACAPVREVSRVDPQQTVDVDYRFNDSDARQVYQGMVQDALSRPWINNFKNENGGKRPAVIVGPVFNATQDYIDTKLITTDIERELINSGLVRFVADKDQRLPVRDERAQGQEWSRPETRKRMKYELGADFMVIGRIMDDKPRTLDGKGGVSYFKVNLEIVDLESNEKVWIGSQEIKKVWRDR
jgi:uncharacterized protein (TIGR02722 family)